MKSLLLYSILIMLAVSSCKTSYSPTSIVPTAFKEAKQTRITPSISGTKLFANIAHTPIKNFYIQAAAGSSYRNTDFAYNVNGGIGYYSTFDDQWQLELQSSYGFGEFDWFESDDRNKFGVQSNIITYAKGDQSNWSNILMISRHGTVKESNNIFTLALRHSIININYEETNRSKLNNNSYTFFQFGPHIIYQESISPITNILFQLGFEFNDDHFLPNRPIKEEQNFSTEGLFFRAGVAFKL